MKKYLMIGLAALAFASCAKHDFETMTQEQIVKAEYDAKFVAHFQQPASNHTWGFGSSTRAFTRGVFSNGNEWAANDRDDCKYRVPPRLSEEQEKVVIKYFQTVQNPPYQDPQWTDYFIQQVYKGGTSPREGYSPETYKAANGTTDIIGSNKMNYLAAIDATQNPVFIDHNENFNNGDCGEKDNVLDFKGTLTTIEETYPVNDQTHRHADKINLMKNSTTKSFGYSNSDASVRRTEYTGLVSYTKIIEVLGDEANCLNDGWNRSFMGFDYEMMIGPELYQDRYVKLSDMPGNAPQYIWDGEHVIKWWDPIYDGYNIVGYNFAEGYDEFVKIDGQKIQYLLNGKNNYAGDPLSASTTLTNITQSNLKVYKDYSDDVKNVECVNLPLLRAAFEAGYLPTSDNATDWVKVGGTADGYYSDWIVTLTEAKKYDVDEPDEPEEFPSTFTGRIMAEDLTAGVDVTGRKSDWDFNDVVFDWAISEDGKKAYVELLAAGGELQIKIGGKLVDGEVVGGVEIHSAQGLGAYMCNTGLKTVPTKKLILNAPDGETYTNGNDILLTVLKNGEWMTIPARRGEPTAKFNCLTTTKWCDEYVDIKKAYTQFNAWVGNENVNWQESQSVVGDLVDGKLENNAAALEALPE